MLKFVIFSAVAAFAVAQLGNVVVDSIHGFLMEYDDRHDIVIMVNDTDCFIVRAVDATWDAIIKNEDELHLTSEALHKQIRAGTGVTPLTQEQENAYHSPIERWQCRNKDAWKVLFTPPTAN